MAPSCSIATAQPTPGAVLNVREAFASEHPDVVERVLAVYEEAREWSLANPKELKALLVKATKLPDTVIVDKQLGADRAHPFQYRPGSAGDTILAAGLALQKAGVIKPDVDVRRRSTL